VKLFKGVFATAVIASLAMGHQTGFADMADSTGDHVEVHHPSWWQTLKSNVSSSLRGRRTQQQSFKPTTFTLNRDKQAENSPSQNRPQRDLFDLFNLKSSRSLEPQTQTATYQFQSHVQSTEQQSTEAQAPESHFSESRSREPKVSESIDSQSRKDRKKQTSDSGTTFYIPKSKPEKALTQEKIDEHSLFDRWALLTKERWKKNFDNSLRQKEVAPPLKATVFSINKSSKPSSTSRRE
jgi:hypothetical protein